MGLIPPQVPSFHDRARVIGGDSMRRTSAGFWKRRHSPSVSEVARRYGIDRRVLCRWKQELTPPIFVAVEITDAALGIERAVS